MLRDSRPRPLRAPHKMPTDPKPTLEMRQLPIFRVHYTKLEAYIKRIFGFEFDFLTAAAVAEGTGVDYLVEKVPEGYDWTRRALSLRMGQRTKEVRLILAVLAQDGYIPFGRYTVATTPLPDPVLQYRALLQQCGDPYHKLCLEFKDAQRGNHAFFEKANVLDKTITDQGKSN